MTEPVTFRPITAERYISHDYLQRERDKIWARTWLVAGVVQDVEEAGDFFVFELEPESIIVSRAEDGGLHAFFNVCQHRGARVMLTERGNMAAYTCPYHGWVYNNDGSLATVPDEERFSRGLPKSELGLKALRVDTWAGLVWVCMDPEAPPLQDYLGPVMALIDPFRPEDMRLVEDQTCRLECNWKAAQEAFIEGYHGPMVHPQVTGTAGYGQHDIFSDHVSRDIIPLGVPSNRGERRLSEQEVLDMMLMGDRSLVDGDKPTVGPGQTARQIVVQNLREIFEEEFGMDLSGVLTLQFVARGLSEPVRVRFRMPGSKEPKKGKKGKKAKKQKKQQEAASADDPCSAP